MNYPPHLLKLIETLKQLPGVGSKSAERFAFHMLGWKKEALQAMSETISRIPEEIRSCKECGCLMGEHACPFCTLERKNSGSLCIVASARDAIFIERTGEHKGLYHVLGHLLSPLQGIGPDMLQVPQLIGRIQKEGIVDVVIGLDSTLEGDTTALYLKRELEKLGLSLTRPALGMPMGSAMDYVDGGTLARAFSGRKTF